jgi:PPOX class probable FMN-dependent enzyme
MSMTQSDPVQTPDLDRLYDQPREIIQKAVMPELNAFHAQYLAQATFFCLATGRDTGLDASPRGGPPGFVKVRDPKTVVFADWPGNNRIESMRNLVQDDRLGMLFLFPGLDVFMRINGHGRIADDGDLCKSLAEGSKIPKTAVVVTVDEVLFHCGKAVNRAKLWAPDSLIDRGVLPTPGQMLAAMTHQDAATALAIDAQYDHSMRNGLYG